MTDDRTLIEELREVDRLLPGLAIEEPPEALIEDVFAHVKSETPLRSEPFAPKRRRPRRAMFAAAAAILLMGGTYVFVVSGDYDSPAALYSSADAPASGDTMFDLYDSGSSSPRARTMPEPPTPRSATPDAGDAVADLDPSEVIRDQIRQELEEQRHLYADATPSFDAEPREPRPEPEAVRWPHTDAPEPTPAPSVVYSGEVFIGEGVDGTVVGGQPWGGTPRERADNRGLDRNGRDGQRQAEQQRSSHNQDGLRSLGYTTNTPSVPPPPPEQPQSESYAHTIDQKWTRVADDPLSTFSIDVDTASYANVRRFLEDGRLPPMDSVRVEEMLNYFSYEYPAPKLNADVPFSVTTEVGPAPWAPEHKLVHVGLQAADIPVDDIPPRNLVFLLDVSGSMNSQDKLPLLKRGLTMMVPQLREEDRVSIVVYAGAAGVVLPPTPGNEHSTIIGALDRLSAGGSTAGAAGIQLAYDLARRNFRTQGVNRVLLATDGDFNVGTSSDAALTELIERERESGVFLTVLGFGTGNLKDSKMESIADHGNGNYAYIDSPAEAHKVLVEEAGSTLVTVAKDVKIQVEFNPATVEGYRLIGYANRKLAHRDFTDDTKDAGEVGAGHSVTALYEVIPVGGGIPDDINLRYQQDKEPSRVSSGSDELMFVKVRYKKPDGRRSTESSWTVADRDVRLSRTSDDFRFSAAIAGWGMLLRGSRYVPGWTLSDPADLAGSALKYDPNGYRNQAMRLMDKATGMATVRSPATTRSNPY